MSILKLIKPRVLAAIKAVSTAAAEIPTVADCGYTSGAGNPKQALLADIQVRGILSAAKRLKLDPTDFAKQIVEKLDLQGVGKATVDGPGFINIKLDDAWLGDRINKLFWGADPRLGAEEWTGRVVLDYSSPNLAKEMHVGHLRSTIIGDALARVLGFVGADVIRQNHVGDWGTQFGMLIAHVYDTDDVNLDQLQDLEALYVQAKIRFDVEEGFADRARDYVVKLQAGDADIVKKWEKIVEVSLMHAQKIYDTLGVLIKRSDAYGESSYNADLPNVVTDLDKAGILAVDQGAKVVYTPAFQKDFGKGKPVFVVQKTGDGFGYAATDLAAMRYRVRHLKGDRLLYVIDNRQSLHCRQLFDVSRRAGFLPENVEATHVGFGTMMGADKKPFKTRTGGTIKLAELIASAQERAYALAKEKNEKRSEADRFTDAQVRDIANKIGIGAIKYADLSKQRDRDYVFDLDAMVQFEGNTAPYLMYAYTRCRAVGRGATAATEASSSAPIATTTTTTPPKLVLTHNAEHVLATTLLQFPDEIANVIATSCPHHLCGYLYRVAGAYSQFYQACPILKSEGEVRASRLRLCEATAELLKTGLGLLGIGVLEVM
ncbi:arginyl-tRNA synthetase [Fimicolochytrium jonesii]|uniref:arginyl-tRNA synthetase n=1 Tax=Fimicolochytrium jonesii TaxID=1396493 RepID=UPI0022FE63A4|nr:arginyl-tRNA synthetase [Fimicolochytrium jonesii]KAI8817840.1 arginyl-tRNA synthetase [Fimicolochytrium jonesii]